MNVLRKKLGVTLAVMTLSVVMFAVPLDAGAEMFSFEAVQDSFIDDNRPTIALGLASSYTVRDLGAEIQHAIMSFDLSSLTGGPIAYAITSATLRLGVPNNRAGGGTHSVYTLNVNFVENQATWNNRATATPWTTAGGLSDAAVFATGVAHGDTLANGGAAWAGGGLDVATQVSDWLAGTQTVDLGFLVQTTSGLRSYDSRESVNGGPTLDIEAFLVPEPGTAMLAGLGLLSLAARRRRSV